MAVAGYEFAVAVWRTATRCGELRCVASLRESRTVSVLRGSSGAETGYSVPPILPMIRCPSGISGMDRCGHEIAAQQPGDGLPFSFATGAKKRSAPDRLRPIANRG